VIDEILLVIILGSLIGLNITMGSIEKLLKEILSRLSND
jgi:hypothetical protein